MSAIAMVSRFIMIEPKYSKSEPAIFISVGVLRRQLLQQRLRFLQIARVEALRKPPVNRSQQFARLLHLALVAPEACEAHGGAEFPGFGLLLTGDGERALEIALPLSLCPALATSARFRLQCDGPQPRTIFPWLFRSLSIASRNAAPSVIELAEFRIGDRQI